MTRFKFDSIELYQDIQCNFHQQTNLSENLQNDQSKPAFPKQN